MPKAIKGNAWPKPPEPSASHSDIDDWIQRQMLHLQPIVKLLDESIRATIPGLQTPSSGRGRTTDYQKWIEGSWLLALSALLIAVTVLVVRRRAV